MFRPGQIADLRSGINILHGLPGERVPEANAAIGRTSAAGQNSVMMRRPGDRLHRSQMFRKCLHRRQRVQTPDKQFIVVTLNESKSIRY